MPDGRSPDPVQLYEQDFYAWTQDQAARLRNLTGDNRLDTAHLAEEVEDLGKSDKRALESHLTEALKHLCKASAVRSDDPVAHWMGDPYPSAPRPQDPGAVAELEGQDRSGRALGRCAGRGQRRAAGLRRSHLAGGNWLPVRAGSPRRPGLRPVARPCSRPARGCRCGPVSPRRVRRASEMRRNLLVADARAGDTRRPFNPPHVLGHAPS